MAEQKRAKKWVPALALLAVALVFLGGKFRQWYDARGVVSLVILPFPAAADLRNTLATVEGVRVMGPTTSAAFPSDPAAQRDLAAQIAVDYIVSANQNRIALRRAADGAETWQGPADPNQLLAALGKNVTVPTAKVSPAAARARQAILSLDHFNGDAKTLLAEARAASAEALQTGDKQPDAHTARAVVLMLSDRNWPEAEQALRRALELRPTDALAARWYAHHLEANGKAGDAIDAMHRALSTEPLAPEIAIPLTLTYIHDKQWDIARDHLAQCETVFPSHPALPMVRAFYHRAQNEWAETIAALRKAPPTHLAIPLLAEATARQGDRAEAARLLATAPENAPAAWIGLAQLALGQTDDAYASFQRAVDAQSPEMVILHASPIMENMHKTPRYKAIAHALRLRRD